MTMLRISANPFTYTARLEEQEAPQTCAAFRSLLPYRQKLIHARWSGEACWVPLGDFALGIGFENATSYPAPGEILWYPGGYSETEISISLWRQLLRQQARPAGRQPFPDGGRGPRAAARDGPHSALGRGAGYSVRDDRVVALIIALLVHRLFRSGGAKNREQIDKIYRSAEG